MLTAKKNLTGDRLKLELSGEVNHDTKFMEIFGPIPAHLEIDTAGVRTINSVGIREWIKYFTGLRKSGVKLSFTHCSAPIVYQINMFANFISADEVRSIYLPFLCSSCSQEQYSLLEIKGQSLAPDWSPANIPCDKCSGVAVFDDVPSEYFNFLVRTIKT